MTRKEGFPPRLHIGNQRFEDQHDRDAPEEDDQDRDDHQSPRGQADLGRVELAPRDDGAEVDKICQIEQQIDDIGHVRFFRLVRKPSIVAEPHAGGKADEQIIHPQERPASRAEERQHEIEDEKTLPVDQSLPVRQFDRMSSHVAHRDPVHGSENTLV